GSIPLQQQKGAEIVMGKIIAVVSGLFLLGVAWSSVGTEPNPAPADASPVFDIPRLENIKIDGDPSEWGDKGFKVGPSMSQTGEVRPAASFDPRFRLAWDDRGLLVLV